jgi:hypothetical protein
MVSQSRTPDEAKPRASPLLWLRRLIRGLSDVYFTVDPRSLGLCRIGLGALLSWDLFRRVPEISVWYSNRGLLPNHTSLFRPQAEYMFSFLFAASTVEEAGLMFFFCGLVFVAFTVGYRTRLTHALSLACIVSLHSRAIFLENGGDVVLNVLCAWTLFLPLGARFSVDAVLRSLRDRRETTIGELNDRAGLPVRDVEPKGSLAALAILVQLSLIYYLNALHKTGWTWRQGSAVHYVFYQERMVTWFGLLLRAYLQPWMTLRITYTTWNIELLAPLLILNPIFCVWTRRVAMVLLPALHLAFAAALNLGQFSFNMIGFFPLLLGPRDWRLFARWFAPSDARARTVLVDERSSSAMAWARLLLRLDVFERLTFAPLEPTSSATDRASWAVENPLTRERTTGARAIADCLAVFPCCLPLAAVLRVGPLRMLGELLLERPANQLLRIAAHGPLATRAARPPSPARRWWRRRLAVVREIAVVITMVALGSQVLMENKVIPAKYKAQAKWMQQVVMYPRLFQGWFMFSPDVPTGERMVYVDALTVTGRHVDPYNEAGSRVADLPVERIPPHMEQNEFWCDFTNRVPDNDTYWKPLKAWVFDYPQRTGNPDDRIVSFEAKLFEQDNPPPGEREPRNPRTRVLFRGYEGE